MISYLLTILSFWSCALASKTYKYLSIYLGRYLYNNAYEEWIILHPSLGRTCIPCRKTNYDYFLIKDFSWRHCWVLNTHTSHNIHVREIFMLNAIYHYDEVRGEINPLYFSWLFYTFNYIFYLVSIEKQNSNIFSELD